MNHDDLEDMLFGNLDLQNCFEDVSSDFSEDDILFSSIGDDTAFSVPTDCLMFTTAKYATADGAQSIFGAQARNGINKPQAPPRDRFWVIGCIETMLEKIMDSLLEDSASLAITLRLRPTLSRRRMTITEGDDSSAEPRERDISFPGANAQEAWNFTVLLRILELVHSALVDNTIMTKRDIYYRHPDLFVKQSVVDRHVDDLAYTLGITRSQLNTAAAKGLVAGNFALIRKCGHRVNGMDDKEGMLVPTIGEGDRLDLSSVHWILVIEKEATFRSILSSSSWDVLGAHGIALTGKGYPDLASRKFLCQLKERASHIPTYAFMDLDPDGIAILSTYKYGSYRLAHESVALKDLPWLNLSGIHWLGVKSEHISQARVGESNTGANMIGELQGLMRLTARDRKKAVRMLEWSMCGEDGEERGWRRELQRMLMLNVKAEMQILDELPGGMVSWIRHELDKVSQPACQQPTLSTGSDDGMLF